MRLFLKTTAIDYLLCVVVSSALSFTVASGFYATQPYQDLLGTLLIVGSCAVLTAALFAVTTSTRAMAIGIPVLALAVAGVLVACFATGPVDAPLDDVAGNSLLFALCVVVPCVACFVLSRTRAGSLVLIIGGIAICALIEYLYWYGHVVAFLVFAVGATVLYAYRVYRRSVLDSDSERFAFGSVSAAAAALAVVAVAVGVGVYTLAIAPLDPPRYTVKLITEHYRADEIEVRGVGDSADSSSEDLSLEQGDEKEKSSEIGTVDDSERGAVGETPFATLGAFQDSASDMLGTGLAGLSMFFTNWTWLIVLLAIAVAVACSIAVKLFLRKRRFDRMVAKGANVAVPEMYLFFLDRFKRLKMPQPDTLTLSEYATSFANVFDEFERRCSGPTFADLTDVYVDQVFGGNDSSEEQLNQFTEYYRLFYKRACGFLGRMKYGWKFFRI